jgi:hypothetical protein
MAWQSHRSRSPVKGAYLAMVHFRKKQACFENPNFCKTRKPNFVAEFFRNKSRLSEVSRSKLGGARATSPADYDNSTDKGQVKLSLSGFRLFFTSSRDLRHFFSKKRVLISWDSRANRVWIQGWLIIKTTAELDGTHRKRTSLMSSWRWSSPPPPDENQGGSNLVSIDSFFFTV